MEIIYKFSLKISIKIIQSNFVNFPMRFLKHMLQNWLSILSQVVTVVTASDEVQIEVCTRSIVQLPVVEKESKIHPDFFLETEENAVNTFSSSFPIDWMVLGLKSSPILIAILNPRSGCCSPLCSLEN